MMVGNFYLSYDGFHRKWVLRHVKTFATYQDRGLYTLQELVELRDALQELLTADFVNAVRRAP